MKKPEIAGWTVIQSEGTSMAVVNRDRLVSMLKYVEHLESKAENLPIHDVMTPVFRDSYGNEIQSGDKIIIEGNYNYPHYNGKEAEVFWNEERGVYKFKFFTEMRKSGHWTNDDFYGIHKFRKVIPKNGS